MFECGSYTSCGGQLAFNLAFARGSGLAQSSVRPRQLENLARRGPQPARVRSALGEDVVRIDAAVWLMVAS